MAVIEPGGASSSAVSLVERAKGLLFTPTPELERAKAERPSGQSLILGYVAPLAAAMAVATLVGQALFEFDLFGVSWRTGLPFNLLNTAINLVLLIAMTWLMGQVIDGLAANFGGAKDPVRAMQTAAYAATGGLVYGLVGTVPWIGWAIALFGILVSVMLLHKGLGVLMGAPADKQVGYTATVILIMLVLWLIAGAVVGAITTPLRQAPMFSGAPTEVRTPWGKVERSDSGTGGSGDIGEGKVKVTIPGVGTIDTGDLGGSIEITGPDGKPVPPIASDKLKALMPENLPGGFQRGPVNAASGAAMGFGASSVSANYVSGGKSLDLTIADTGAMGQLGSGLASAFGATVESTTDDGYKRVRTVNGRPTIEEYSKATGISRYVVLIGGRIVVTAEANGVSGEELTRLIDALGPAQIETLAKAPQ